MIYEEARECWEQLSTFRKKRNRCRDYTYGRQWNDLIEVDGKMITEYEYILSEGNVPLKNNLIRRIVRNVLGVFRSKLDLKGYKEVAEVWDRNSMRELFSRTMEEFLISGMAVHRKRLSKKEGIITEMVSPDSFFFNTDSRDVRGSDLRIIGQIHNVDIGDWCRSFVKSRDDYRNAMQLFDKGKRKLRVTEVWRREPAERYVVHLRERGLVRKVREEELRYYPKKAYPRKWVMEEVWRYYFLSDDGQVLLEGDSPYLHGSHPYVMKCYPFLDGEIHSFVGDMIDQQRYTNRLITLYDWVIRASAKGVLLLPESAVSSGNYQTVANQWSRFNGVIVYKPKAGDPEPKQVSGNMGNLGISELLEIQLKMMEDVSGVNGILQGNTSGGNVSGALYNSQTTNALYSLADIMETYQVFIKDCAAMDRKLLVQRGESSFS